LAKRLRELGRRVASLDGPFPGVALVLHYRRSWLRADLIAGIALWAPLVPAGLALGQLAGVSPVAGLYVAAIGGLAYALLGTSRYLPVGPESAIAILVAAEVGPLANGDAKRYAALAATLALLTGCFLAVGYYGRLGIVTRLFSAPVLTGYLAGSAVVIVVSQLSSLTGIQEKNVYPNVLWRLARHVGDLEPWAVGIAVFTGGLVVILPRFSRKVPASLLALAITTAFVTQTGLATTIDVVGTIPRGLPNPALPSVDFGDIEHLIGPSLSIAVFVFSSATMIGEMLAARDGETIRPNREFLALAGANLGVGFFQGFPAAGSISRSLGVAETGGRSQLASSFASLLVVLTLVVLTPLFRNLPRSALAAVVVIGAIRLVDIAELRRLRRIHTGDFALALATLGGVLVFGVVKGIAIGVLVSLAGVLARAAMPHTAVLGYIGGGAYGDVESHRWAETVPGLAVFRFDAPLFFANADAFAASVRELVDDERWRVREIVVDAEAIYDVDTTALAMLVRLHDQLEARRIRLSFVSLRTSLHRLFSDAELECSLGRRCIYPRVQDAVDAFRALTPSERT